MQIISQSKDYYKIPKYRLTHYVRYHFDGYFFAVEVDENNRRFDARQMKLELKEVPKNIALQAYALAGFYPSYVEWEGVKQ